MTETNIYEPKCIGETESYAIGYEHGLKAGIYNTLTYLENNGVIHASEFQDLKQQIENLQKETSHL